MATAASSEIGVPCIVPKEETRRSGIALPVLIGALIALFSFLLVPRSVSDPDIWWHLKDAQLQLASHSFLRHDVFSFTAANAAWMNHEWLSELPYLLGWKAFGAVGVYSVTVLTVTALMLGIFMLAWRDSGTPKASVVAMLPAMLLSSVSFGPRTLLFGWLVLIAELAVLQSFRRDAADRNQLWLLPPMFALWVNTHGSWMIGLVLFGLFAVTGLFQFQSGGLYSERWSALQRATIYKVAAASVVALFCNPYGWRLVLYPFNMAFHQKLNIASVEEWRSVDFHVFRGKLFLVVIATLILFRILQRTRWSLQDAAFAFVALYSGLTYSRFLFLAAILLTPLLARDLAEWMPYDRSRSRSLFNAAALAVVVFLAFSHPPTRKQLETQPLYPVAATEWLSQHPPQGPTFNEYLWGGYMEFHAPAIKTFIDSRMDIFEYNGTLRDYLDTIHLTNSLALLDKYHIQNVYIATKSPLAYLLFHTAGWKPVYQDDVAVLFTRK
jgi:hypothetical protein